MIKTKGKNDPDTKIQTKINRNLLKKLIKAKGKDVHAKICVKFRSDVHANFLRFFDIFLWFGSPWEMWILKLFRRHQFFEAMLILKVPGIRNIIFEEFYVVGKSFSKILSETYFSSGHFFKNMFKNIFPKNGIGATLVLGVNSWHMTKKKLPYAATKRRIFNGSFEGAASETQLYKDSLE